MAKSLKKQENLKDTIISLRFRKEQLEYIEYLLELNEQATGIQTDRSKLIFSAIELGFKQIQDKLEKLI